MCETGLLIWPGAKKISLHGVLKCGLPRTQPPLPASVGVESTTCMPISATLFTMKPVDCKGADASTRNQHGGMTAAMTQWSVATLLGADSKESHRILTALPTSVPAHFFTELFVQLALASGRAGSLILSRFQLAALETLRAHADNKSLSNPLLYLRTWTGSSACRMN